MANSAPKPKASILINNFNYGNYVGAAIESALAQDSSDFEVVVVDDGSTDNSREIINRYARFIKPIFQANQGQAGAFNTGVNSSQGGVIFLLDSDDVIDRNRLSIVLDRYDDNPDADWVFHELRWVAQDGITLLKPEPSGAARKYDLRNKRFRFPSPATSGLSFRRQLANRLFPMPGSLRIASDNYLKFAAVLTSPGIYLGNSLGSLRIHANNAYSGGVSPKKKAELDMRTALELMIHFPQLHRFSDRLATIALAHWRAYAAGGEQFESLWQEYDSRIHPLRSAQIKLLAAVRTLRYKAARAAKASSGSPGSQPSQTATRSHHTET